MPSVTEGVPCERASAFPNRENVLSNLDCRRSREGHCPQRGRPVHLDKCDVEAGVSTEQGRRVSRLLAVERDSHLSRVRYDVIVGQYLATACEDHPAALFGPCPPTQRVRCTAGPERLDRDHRRKDAREDGADVVHVPEHARARGKLDPRRVVASDRRRDSHTDSQSCRGSNQHCHENDPDPATADIAAIGSISRNGGYRPIKRRKNRICAMTLHGQCKRHLGRAEHLRGLPCADVMFHG